MLKFYPAWFMFFLLMMTGVLLVASSEHYFFMWIGFELSLLSFLPMFMRSLISTEGLAKYFLAQVSGSTIFLAVNLWSPSYTSIVIVFAMSLKLGAAPFYQWVPSVMGSLSWGGCAILATLQKAAPLMVIAVTKESGHCVYFIMLLGSISVLVGGVKGFNQSQLRPLMGYSSIAHTGWMMLALSVSTTLLVVYFIVYSYLIFTLFWAFDASKATSVASGSRPYDLADTCSLTLLSLAGLPPFSMFYLKGLIMIFLTDLGVGATLLGLLAVFGTYVSLHYYLAFVVPSLLKHWNTPVRIPLMMIIQVVVAILAFPILMFN